MINSILGKKKGMTQMFREGGGNNAVTVIEAGPCTVYQLKNDERDGYTAAQLGFGKAKRLTSPVKGHVKEMGSPRYLREVPVENTEGIEVGQQIDFNVFQVGDRVDVTGVSKGKGFTGSVKRHHFSGGPKTHGQSDRHRAPGSIGAGTTPGRVFKGTRMAGHLGHEKVTALNLEVISTDPERNLIFVKGSVPGANDGLVILRKTNRGK
ncbi:50S ribosomal protein L3 [Chloroflexota bacterium]